MDTQPVRISTFKDALRWGDSWQAHAETLERTLQKTIDEYEEKLRLSNSRLVIARAERALLKYPAPHQFPD